MENTPLLDYLDKKVAKWWEKPEVVNALLTDRTYHLTHLQLVGTGSLSITDMTAISNYDGSTKYGKISVVDFYQEKYGIELRHPEFPLFTCDDGLDAKIPVEVITLEIPSNSKAQLVGATRVQTRQSIPLLNHLKDTLGKDWLNDPIKVNGHLKDLIFYAKYQDGIYFGNLKVGGKSPSNEMKREGDALTYQEYFKRLHNYEIENRSIPLFSVHPTNRKKFLWPGELIFLVQF